MSIKDDVESLRYEANNNYSMYASTKIASQGPLPPNQKKKKRKKKASQTPHHGRIFPHQSKRHRKDHASFNQRSKVPNS